MKVDVLQESIERRRPSEEKDSFIRLEADESMVRDAIALF